MRVVIDTNIFVSALIRTNSIPSRLITLWRQNRFELVSSDEQLDELRRVTRYEKLRTLLNTALTGRLINEIKTVATIAYDMPTVDACRDPMDNFLLATAQAGNADFIVTGDKADLLSMTRYGSTKIVSVREFLYLVDGGNQ